MNQPNLPEYLVFYYDAFLTLSFDRPVGFVEGYIPTDAIVKYGQFYDMPRSDIEDLIYFVRGIDQEHIKYQMAKANQEKKTKK